MNNSSDNNPKDDSNHAGELPSAAAPDIVPAEKTEPASVSSSGQTAQRSGLAKWVIGMLVVVGVIGLVYQSNKKGTPPSSDLSSTASASVPANDAGGARKSAPAQNKKPFTEERPASGGGKVLTMPQLRYCAAENIRLDAAKEAIDTHNTAAVDRFNLLNADYNERCINLRYRRGTLEQAKSEVDKYRPQLEAEGRALFAPPVAALPASKPASKPAAKAEAKPAAKAEAKPATKAETKPEAKPVPKPRAPVADAKLPGEAKVEKPKIPLAKYIDSTAPTRASCTSSTECAGANLCLDGHCRPLRSSGEQCVYSHECSGATKCIRGHCRPQGSEGARCTRSQECAGTNQCLDGHCRALRVKGEGCEASFECAGMNECVQGHCQLPP